MAKIEASERWWLSTDGTGVHWLHIRMENSPRYFKREGRFAERGAHRGAHGGVWRTRGRFFRWALDRSYRAIEVTQIDLGDGTWLDPGRSESHAALVAAAAKGRPGTAWRPPRR